MSKNASDTMVKIWMQGALELANDVEVALEILSKKEQFDSVLQNNTAHIPKIQRYTNPKEKLKKLQILIIVHIEKLIKQYPYTLLIYRSIEDLLNMNASDDLIQSWLNSIDDFVALLDTKSSI